MDVRHYSLEEALQNFTTGRTFCPDTLFTRPDRKVVVILYGKTRMGWVLCSRSANKQNKHHKQNNLNRLRYLEIITESSHKSLDEYQLLYKVVTDPDFVTIVAFKSPVRIDTDGKISKYNDAGFIAVKEDLTVDCYTHDPFVSNLLWDEYLCCTLHSQDSMRALVAKSHTVDGKVHLDIRLSDFDRHVLSNCIIPVDLPNPMYRIYDIVWCSGNTFALVGIREIEPIDHDYGCEFTLNINNVTAVITNNTLAFTVDNEGVIEGKVRIPSSSLITKPVYSNSRNGHYVHVVQFEWLKGSEDVTECYAFNHTITDGRLTHDCTAPIKVQRTAVNNPTSTVPGFWNQNTKDNMLEFSHENSVERMTISHSGNIDNVKSIHFNGHSIMVLQNTPSKKNTRMTSTITVYGGDEPEEQQTPGPKLTQPSPTIQPSPPPQTSPPIQPPAASESPEATQESTPIGASPPTYPSPPIRASTPIELKAMAEMNTGKFEYEYETSEKEKNGGNVLLISHQPDASIPLAIDLKLTGCSSQFEGESQTVEGWSLTKIGLVVVGLLVCAGGLVLIGRFMICSKKYDEEDTEELKI